METHSPDSTNATIVFYKGEKTGQLGVEIKIKDGIMYESNAVVAICTVVDNYFFPIAGTKAFTFQVGCHANFKTGYKCEEETHVIPILVTSEIRDVGPTEWGWKYTDSKEFLITKEYSIINLPNPIQFFDFEKTMWLKDFQTLRVSKILTALWSSETMMVLLQRTDFWIIGKTSNL